MFTMIRASALVLFILVMMVGGAFSSSLKGRISKGVYTSPGKLFTMDVPVMHNPFVKKPSAIQDAQRVDGGAEVLFAVPDLGEAYRFGVRPLADSLAEAGVDLARLCDEELQRWHKSSSKPQVLAEEAGQPGDTARLARVYFVESGSLLNAQKGTADPVTQGALIGVVVRVSPAGKQALYAVGQFDMPNYGGFYTLETEKGRSKLAAQHLKRMLELSASLRLH